MSDHLDLIGNWVEHVGTVIAAIGETKQLVGDNDNDIGLGLGVLGNSIQGLGNIIQASSETVSVEVEFGNWIQAAGTISNAIAEYQMLQDSITDILEAGKIEVVGDIFQSLGSLISANGRLEEHRGLVDGNIVQSIGAALEGIGVVYSTILGEERRGQTLEVIGGWLQAIGTGYQSIGITKQYLLGNGKDN
ncbi:hypothetical protein QA612_14060 [Evansella sp. AB-P1]|uniref:DUF6944 family repetitive protein n=1 Tax=Evansella sp. AB-P1 TaxID=3037653 RepID=UPI00241D45FF|nr:hypothetical protein [Evansella sp. AB-P1]MDG5788606.1 hypothetical protein [Evansella sp. AB-P1]